MRDNLMVLFTKYKRRGKFMCMSWRTEHRHRQVAKMQLNAVKLTLSCHKHNKKQIHRGEEN